TFGAWPRRRGDRIADELSLSRCPLLAQSRHGLVHCTCPLSGVKRTWRLRCGMTLIPKADITEPFHYRYLTRYHRPEIGGADEAARVHHIGGSCGGCPATWRTGTTASNAHDWVSQAHGRCGCRTSRCCSSSGSAWIRL